MKAPRTGRRATPFWSRRSNFAAIWRPWPSCAGNCRRAARSPRIIVSWARRARWAFADLFGNKETLIIYSYMFGPKHATPCPSCTSFMATWEEKMPDIEQRVSLVMMARSPIEKLFEAKKARGWTRLRVYSDKSGDYTCDYVSADDADIPAYNVFTRRDGTIRHFWSGEMSGAMADPGQDPRGAPDPDPLWALFDTMPEGRGANWYPKLHYPPQS